MKKVLLFLVSALVCMTCMTGCGDENSVEEENSVPLTGITVDPPSLSIIANSSHKLTATPVPANATGVWFEWSSSDPSVATVYSDGTVFIKKYVTGTTTVTVKSGSIEVTVPVSVQEVPLTGITVDVDDDLRIPVPGATVQVHAKPEPANVTGEIVYSWRSSNTDIAIVDEIGKITAVSDGTTDIIVSSGSIEKTITLTVGLEDIIVEEAVEVPIINGRDTKQLTAVSVPRTDVVIPYIWESDNTSVATVSETGVLTAIDEGTANVTVTYGAVTKTIAVTVRQTTWPFKGPHTLSAAAPCIIDARDFDFGGEGFAFHDNTSNNEPGGSYRADNGDPASAAADVESGGNIGYTNAGEWQVYTVEVQDAGVYEADVYLSVSSGDGGAFSLAIDGNKSENTTAPDNSAWSDWRWVFVTYPNLKPTQPKFRLSVGKHKVRFNYESGGFNLMSFKFTRISD